MNDSVSISAKTLNGMQKRLMDMGEQLQQARAFEKNLRAKLQKQRNEIGRLTHSLEKCASEKRALHLDLVKLRGEK